MVKTPFGAFFHGRRGIFSFRGVGDPACDSIWVMVVVTSVRLLAVELRHPPPQLQNVLLPLVEVVGTHLGRAHNLIKIEKRNSKVRLCLAPPKAATRGP